jgi:hypothetical protein
MKIYIASFFETRERLLPIRDQLRTLGYEVTSRWLDEGKKPEEMSRADWWESLATKDLLDIRRADVLILDTIDVNPRGGREVEWGYATAIGNITYVVGPRRNVFHTLADGQFANWDAALGFFERLLEPDVSDDAEWIQPSVESFFMKEPWIADPVRDAEVAKAIEEAVVSVSVKKKVTAKSTVSYRPGPAGPIRQIRDKDGNVVGEQG